MEVSVIMPLYNKELYVEEAIYSILRQSYQKFNLIIVDDASTDKSKEIVKSIIDERIILIELIHNVGVSEATNIAIKHSDGDVIVRMDADDIATIDRIECIVNYFKNNDVDVVGSYFDVFSSEEIPKGINRLIDFSNKIISNKDIVENFTVMPIISQPTMAYKRGIFDEDLYYNSKYKTAEDYEQLSRMIMKNKRIEKIPKVLLKYRYIGKSLSNSNSFEGILNTLEIKLKHIIEFYELKNIKIYIWGIKDFAGYLKDIIDIYYKSIKVKAFIDFDCNQWGSYKNELEIISPNKLIESFEKGDIIITMWNIERNDIIEFLEKNKLMKNIDYFVFS